MWARLHRTTTLLHPAMSVGASTKMSFHSWTLQRVKKIVLSYLRLILVSRLVWRPLFKSLGLGCKCAESQTPNVSVWSWSWFSLGLKISQPHLVRMTTTPQGASSCQQSTTETDCSDTVDPSAAATAAASYRSWYLEWFLVLLRWAACGRAPHSLVLTRLQSLGHLPLSWKCSTAHFMDIYVPGLWRLWLFLALAVHGFVLVMSRGFFLKNKPDCLSLAVFPLPCFNLVFVCVCPAVHLFHRKLLHAHCQIYYGCCYYLKMVFFLLF